MIEVRRRYEELYPAERAIIRFGYPHEVITRDDAIEALEDEWSESEIRDAFSRLCDENRLVRHGQSAEYMMVSRDLF